MNTRVIFLILLVSLITLSCERLLMEAEPDNSPHSLFEQVWQFADAEYSYFELKGIDWQAIHAQYEKQITDTMSEKALFDVLADMLFVLRDGHVNLTAPFNRSRNWQWYLDYPPNYDYTMLQRHYFMDEQQYAGPFIMYDFEDVGYLHYRSFSQSVSDKDMTYVLNEFKNHKGLIIDLRNNGGGSLSNTYSIARYFVEEETPVALQRDKKGPGHNDFGDLKTLQLQPAGDLAFTKPVVLLTNRLCYSATNHFVTMMRELPQVTVIGDQTGGGGGIPAYTELSNGWVLRVSSTQLFTLNGDHAENGIPPDIAVNMSAEDKLNNKDTLLEYALSYIRAKTQ